MADQYTPEEIRAIFEEYNNAVKSNSPVTAEMTARMKDATAGIKNYSAQLNASLKSLGSSVFDVAKAMKDGKQGASAYNDSINAAADAVEAFASKFGFLGKILGTMITAGARYAAEINKQSDALFDAYKNLSSSGLGDAGGMRTIFDNMQKFGYGIEQLGDMTALLKANSKELAAFGGTAASGTKAFADAAGQIQRSDVGKSLQMLGKTPDEINKGIALFVKQQQSAGVSSANIQQNLAQKSADYVKNLDLLSKLTGDDASRLQEKLDAAMAEDAFNQTVYELRKKEAAGDKEAGRLANEYENAARRLTGESLKEFQQGVGGDISAMGKTLLAAGDAVGMIGKSSFTASGYIDTLTKGVVQQRNAAGELFKLNAAKDFMFSAKEMSELESRNAEKTAALQEDRAKAEQELQTKGLEPATKAQVEMRIEQMKTRDSLQSLINKGINPVTDAMKHLASGIETVTGKIPGTGTSTGTQMGGAGGPSGGFFSNLFGGKKVSGQSGALLDLIGKGESGGNYNALVGGGTADLTNMTVAQVQELQKKMLKEGRASSAVGKYQMISSTLAEQMKKAGLDPNTTKFDQGTQDLLAQQLVNQAGYGKKDPATVMRNLAGTWAALPKDMSGRGAYDGYNTNKANINPNELMAAITGPNGGYQSKTSGLNPSASLPTATSSNAPATSGSDQTQSYDRMVELLEQQTRIASESADALGRIRQNTAV
jgi:muramidase (phage lysozyme)